MNDIQQIVTNFLAAAERLESLTIGINVMADQLEPALHTAGEVKAPGFPNDPANVVRATPMAPPAEFAPNYVNQMPTATENYPPIPAGPMPDYSRPAAPPEMPEMIAARDAAVAEIAEQAQVPQHVMPTPPPAQPVAQQTPWDAQAAAAAAEPTAAEEPEKKSGRRTNEDIARELGVDLAKVKAWKGGGRISKKDMEEYKTTHPEEVAAAPVPAAAPAQPSNPFGGAAQAAPAPQQPAQPPQAQYNPPAPTAPQPVPAQAQGAPQEWPAVGQPATPPAPGQAYGDWPTVEGNGFSPSNPFGG